MPINVSLEFTDEDGRAVVREEVRRRYASKVPYTYGREIEDSLNAAIREGIKLEVADLDLRAMVRGKIEATLEQILADAVRRQIKDIVRLAVHQELASVKAEFQDQQ